MSAKIADELRERCAGRGETPLFEFWSVIIGQPVQLLLPIAETSKKIATSDIYCCFRGAAWYPRFAAVTTQQTHTTLAPVRQPGPFPVRVKNKAAAYERLRYRSRRMTRASTEFFEWSFVLP